MLNLNGSVKTNSVFLGGIHHFAVDLPTNEERKTRKCLGQCFARCILLRNYVNLLLVVFILKTMNVVAFFSSTTPLHLISLHPSPPHLILPHPTSTNLATSYLISSQPTYLTSSHLTSLQQTYHIITSPHLTLFAYLISTQLNSTNLAPSHLTSFYLTSTNLTPHHHTSSYLTSTNLTPHHHTSSYLTPLQQTSHHLHIPTALYKFSSHIFNTALATPLSRTESSLLKSRCRSLFKYSIENY